MNRASIHLGFAIALPAVLLKCLFFSAIAGAILGSIGLAIGAIFAWIAGTDVGSAAYRLGMLFGIGGAVLNFIVDLTVWFHKMSELKTKMLIEATEEEIEL